MAYTGVTGSQIYAGFISQLEAELENCPTGELTEQQAESFQQSLTQKAYEEAGKVIDPDKSYPPIIF